MIVTNMSSVSEEKIGDSLAGMEYYDKIAVQWCLRFFNTEFGVHTNIKMKALSRLHTGLSSKSLIQSAPLSDVKKQDVPLLDSDVHPKVVGAQADAGDSAVEGNGLSLEAVAMALSLSGDEEEFGAIEDERALVTSDRIEQMQEALDAAQRRVTAAEQGIGAMRATKQQQQAPSFATLSSSSAAASEVRTSTIP